MEKSRSPVLVIGLILLLAIVGWMAYAVVSTVRQTVNPVNALGTQAAQILNPTPTILPDPVTIIHSVQSLARLETIQYSLEKVITAETNQGPFGFLFGDRLLLVAHGDVIAGVDLSKLQPEDLRLENGVLYVQLPEPEIFVATLDNDKTYVYDREVGLLNKGEVNLETAARQAAEQEILNAALEDGILEQARTNAENYLYRLFRDLGFPEVIFLPPQN